LEGSCWPFDQVGGKPIAPCGAIANSMFQDTFQLYAVDSTNGGKRKVEIRETDISWSTDRRYRYKNPPKWLDTYQKPINWTKPANELDPTNPNNNEYQNEHFIVWMRTAAFPKFRKLWG